MAFAAFAVASWALAYGLAFGWTSFTFRTFFFLGGIANVPLLAAGSLALVSERAGRIAVRVVLLWCVAGFFATFLSPFNMPLPSEAVPEGSEVFDFTFAIDALQLPGPRVFAAVSGAVGTLVVIGVALVSVVRSWTPNRRLANANLLIIAGILAPALGGSLTAIGDSSALAISLALGAVLLWLGYRKAVDARRLNDTAADLETSATKSPPHT